MSDLTKMPRAFFSSSFRAFGLIAAIAFLICLAAVESASAATYMVMTNADSGAGNLRQARMRRRAVFSITLASHSLDSLKTRTGKLNPH